MSKRLMINMFGKDKPVIAMAHFPPLPGTPWYDEKKGVEGMLDSMKEDLRKLLAGGVDGILFCNEGDRPYALQAGFEAAAVMARDCDRACSARPPVWG